jgi:putative pyruvate formate lyase activating enzyme
MSIETQSEVTDRLRFVKETLKRCNLCPRQCTVNRTAGELGYCKLDDKVRCFREMLHYNEEAELTPSHQIYFAGCNLKCEFCTVSEWNEQPQAAREMNLDWLIERIKYRQSQGAKTINLLGGEPTVSLHGVIELISHINSSAKVVLNSNMYYSDLVDELLCGLVDIYLADLKCGNSNCAEALLKAGDYVEVARHNILKAGQHSDLIVRHLIMPHHIKCCLEPTLKWLAEEMPDVKLSLRTDYIPPAKAISAPKEYTASRDIEAAINYAEKLGLNLIE